MYLTIAALAALENIFPPVPADTAAALGAFLAARNPAIWIWVVYVVTVTSNVATASLTYALARRHGQAFLESRLGRRLINEHAVSVVRHRYERHHTWAIFASRILPVYRAVVPPFAGLIGVPPSRALPPIALEAALYYGAIVYLAHTLGENWDAISRALDNLGVALAAAAALVTVLLVWIALRRRSRRG